MIFRFQRGILRGFLRHSLDLLISRMPVTSSMLHIFRRPAIPTYKCKPRFSSWNPRGLDPRIGEFSWWCWSTLPETNSKSTWKWMIGRRSSRSVDVALEECGFIGATSEHLWDVNSTFKNQAFQKLRYIHWKQTTTQDCWWKKSCTTWNVYNLVNDGINYLLAGAGFLPSTIVPQVGGCLHMTRPRIPWAAPWPTATLPLMSTWRKEWQGSWNGTLFTGGFKVDAKTVAGHFVGFALIFGALG